MFYNDDDDRHGSRISAIYIQNEHGLNAPTVSGLEIVAYGCRYDTGIAAGGGAPTHTDSSDTGGWRYLAAAKVEQKGLLYI